jgi:hypothetical protein
MANVDDPGGNNDPIINRSVGVVSISQGDPEDGCYGVYFSNIPDTTQVAIISNDGGAMGAVGYYVEATDQYGSYVLLVRRNILTSTGVTFC